MILSHPLKVFTRRLAESIRQASGEIDAVVLAQASMARAEARLASELSLPIFSSLRLPVLRVRQVMGYSG